MKNIWTPETLPSRLKQVGPYVVVTFVLFLWIAATPLVHSDLIARADSVDFQRETMVHDLHDPLTRSTAVLLSELKAGESSMAVAFLTRDSHGKVVGVTAGGWVKDSSSIVAAIPDRLEHTSHPQTVAVSTIFANVDVGILGLSGGQGDLQRDALPLAPSDPVVGETVRGFLVSNGAHPERFDAAQDTHASGSTFYGVVDRIDGQLVVYCRRCEDGDNGTALVNSHGEVVGFIWDTLRLPWAQNEYHLPVAGGAIGMLARIVPVSEVRKALAHAESRSAAS